MSDFYDVPFRRWRYYKGPKGVGGWTTQPDTDGWFYSFYLKPTGKGARSGQSNEFKYVPRLTSKRRRRKSCEERSFNLAFGKKVTDGIQAPKPTRVNPPGTGYCMKEKKHVLVESWTQIEAKNGRLMLRGLCPDCGTQIQKYGKLIDCPECEQYAEAAANDYICKLCRANESHE